MIKLLKTESHPVEAHGTIVLNWDVRIADAAPAPANHNLTREARESNVVPLNVHVTEPDFRPDLGARIQIAA